MESCQCPSFPFLFDSEYLPLCLWYTRPIERSFALNQQCMYHGYCWRCLDTAECRWSSKTSTHELSMVEICQYIAPRFSHVLQVSRKFCIAEQWAQRAAWAGLIDYVVERRLRVNARERIPRTNTYRRLWNELCSAGEHSFAFRTFQILFMGYGNGNCNGERLVRLLLILLFPMRLVVVAECTQYSSNLKFQSTSYGFWSGNWLYFVISMPLASFSAAAADFVVRTTNTAIEPFLAITLAVRECELMSLCWKGNQSALHFALRPNESVQKRRSKRWLKASRLRTACAPRG